MARRIDYLECPRCRGKDFYEAVRQVGSIGSFGEIGDSERFVGGQRAVNKKVKLCRECGEQPITKSRMSTPQEDAEWEIQKEQIRATVKEATPTLIWVGLFFAVCAIGIIWSLASL
jgi:hypothetical protein